MTGKTKDSWLSTKDPLVVSAEDDLDKGAEPDPKKRIQQLRTQRRRALRRALSLENVLHRLLKAAVDGTAEEVQEAFSSAQRVLSIPSHSAFQGLTDVDQTAA